MKKIVDNARKLCYTVAVAYHGKGAAVVADVFISYHEASAGEKSPEKIVPKIAAALEDVGVSCWYAERDLIAPDAFAATITREIRVCKIFLLVLNEGSNQSEHVKNEVALAFSRIAQHGKMKLIIFKVDNCILSEDMAYYLYRQQRVDANPPSQERIHDLAEQIANILYGLPTWEMIYTRNQLIDELKLKIARLEEQLEKLQKKQPTDEKKSSLLDVFISYHVSESSNLFVYNLASRLESANISCWYAPRNVRPGEFVVSILEAIDKCRVFLIILDEGANGPGYVFNETVEAYNLHKKEVYPFLIPFQIGKFQITRELNFYLRPFPILYGGDSFETADTTELIAKITDTLAEL